MPAFTLKNEHKSFESILLEKSFRLSALSFKMALGFKKVLGFRLWAFGLLIVSLLSFNNLKAQNFLPDNPALRQLLEKDELKYAFVGIYIYDDSLKKEIAGYQSDKYFVPASNTKLFSLYAGMKYLGDSLTGMEYLETDTALYVFPTGDPTLLHPDFQSQPVFDFLKKTHKKIYLVDGGWKETPWGEGWAWDDYNDDYSVERSPFPVYGNFIRWTQQRLITRSNPAFEPTATVFSSPEIPWKVRFSTDSLPRTFLVRRAMDSNVFSIRLGNETEIQQQDVPFITSNLNAAMDLLPDTLGKPVHLSTSVVNTNASKNLPHSGHHTYAAYAPPIFVYSRPVDSVFIPMMYRSDNFFAEQTLLMVSNRLFGYMNDKITIDSLLAANLADLPQPPSWVDGSGLSRYNLFSPMDFVTLLIKFKNEFGMDRMKRILPTGGTGTLKNYYRSDSGYVFAKTGSMGGVFCLSGYIYSIKKHLLVFSILVNNHNSSPSAIRREIESYIETLRRNN
jgi:D-alanyl-D-alanine carboxypeptidase/D-alanyl-D-alanine-endopeptidase (penicillin-binding protein 4)